MQIIGMFLPADEGRPISFLVTNSFNSLRIFEDYTNKYFVVFPGHNSRDMCNFESYILFIAFPKALCIQANFAKNEIRCNSDP